MEAMSETEVLRLREIDRRPLTRLLAHYGLELRAVAPTDEIPGSYWGECEAGLRGQFLYVRVDTPLHSILHEAAHYVCMTPERRASLERDAGGDEAEECAVCYLQLLLADGVPSLGRERLFTDMDRWGYSFRLGAARAWFQQDATDARAWLEHHGLIDRDGQPTGQVRTS
jgi:hypothetical protein